MFKQGAMFSRGHLRWCFPLLAALALWSVACTAQPTATTASPVGTAAPPPTTPPTSVATTPAPTPAAATATRLPTVTPAPTTEPAPTATPEPAQSPAPAAAPQASLDVAAEIVNFTLPQLTVPLGATVTWTNRDGVSHTSTSGASGSPDGVWDSSVLPRGNSFSFTFETAGEFPYFCRIHPSMQGTVTVE